MGEIKGQSGDKIIVDFETKLPLREGRYNIMTVLSKTLYVNRSVEFIDITKGGLYFDVLEAKPFRIWNQVQLPNSVKLRRFQNH